MSSFRDRATSSSYRKIFGDAPRFSSPASRSGTSTAGSPQLSSVGRKSMASYHSSSSSSSRFYRQVGHSTAVYTDSLDLTQTSAINNELKIVRTNEKEQLQGLNDRFATFIDKVRHLEQQNKALESELATLRQKQKQPSRLGQLYDQELKELRSRLEELDRDRDRIAIERSNLEEELQKLSVKHNEEVNAREEAEKVLKSFRKDVDEAAATRLDLERRVDSLLDEISFLKKVHDEEIQELSSVVEAQQQVSLELELAKPDLTSALKEIRVQYESVASRNLQSAEEWYKSRFTSLSEQVTRSNEAVRVSREEINDYRRQLQSRTIEIETMRGASESLERQINEMEVAHGAEVTAMQDVIAHLHAELRDLKDQMAHHLREYQELLNIKMALDVEIAAYRKLLEGGETHFNSEVTLGAASYSLHPQRSTRSYRSSRREMVTKENVKDDSKERDETDVSSENRSEDKDKMMDN